jgi:hypothetical protein
MAVVLPIISQFVSKGFDEAETGLKNLGKATAIASAAFVAVTAGLVSSLHAAVDDAAGQDLLRQTLEKTTGANKKAVAENEDFISSLSNSVAVADDQLRPALSTLVTGTKDLGKAQKLLKVSLDVSAATGRSLFEVSEAMSRGFAGNTRGLQVLSPELKLLIQEGASFSEVLEVLEDNFDGAAEAAGNTAAGQFKKLSIGMGEMQEGIGAALLPALDTLLPVLLQMSDWAQAHSTMFAAIIVAIGVLAGLMLAQAAATAVASTAAGVWAVATGVASAAASVFSGVMLALNLIMAVNPFVLVAVAIAAFVAAIVIAYKKSETFRNIVDAVGEALHGAFDWVVDFFKKLPGKVDDAFKKVGDKAVDLIARIRNIFKDVTDVITAPFKSAFNLIAETWNDTVGSLSFKVPGWVPVLANKAWSMPQIPTFAEGGIVTGPTLALIGEAGPEAVIPLSKAGGVGGVMGGTTYNITVDAGLISSGVDVGQMIIDAIQRAERQSGPVFARA